MEMNRKLIKENSTLRSAARDQLSGHWGIALLLCLVSTIIIAILVGIIGRFLPGYQSFSTIMQNGGDTTASNLHTFLSTILHSIVAAPFVLGLISCFIKLVRDEPFRFEGLFDGFKHLSSALILNLLILMFTTLWTLLLIIPGIIAGYRYSMAFYILNDNPEIGAMEALGESKEMMKGYKWKLFCLQLSFIGWAILSILSCGIGLLWLIPYIQASTANFYQNLKDASEGSPSIDENKIPYEINPTN